MRTKSGRPKYFLCSLTTLAARKMIGYYNRVLEPLGLTAQQVMALGVVWNGEGLSLGEFAQTAGIGKAAAATMIQRLEILELVSRRPHPRDGRLIEISLTQKAHDLIPVLLEKVEYLEDAVEGAVGPDDIETMIKALTAITELDL